MVNFSFQLDSIGMWCVPTDYRRVVLDFLGGDQLRKLDLYDCTGVDPLIELLPLKRLQVLAMWDCILTPIADAAAFAELVPRTVLEDCSNQFLPQLQELDADRTCLGF